MHPVALNNIFHEPTLRKIFLLLNGAGAIFLFPFLKELSPYFYIYMEW